jgi:hypothetical protein
MTTCAKQTQFGGGQVQRGRGTQAQSRAKDQMAMCETKPILERGGADRRDMGSEGQRAKQTQFVGMGDPK